jgi:hypothetical protein
MLKILHKGSGSRDGFLFRSELEEKEQTLAEVRTKFSKNKQILTSNWEQAEAEVSPMTLYPVFRIRDPVPF